MEQFNLKPGMLMGTATAATQIEGGDRNNSWYHWCQTGHIKDGSSCLRACGHYNRVEEDIGLMSSMKLQIYRFGIEWSRIEPERGKYSMEAVEHYKKELLLLKQHGILPLMTLHHFSNPAWFEEAGAFLNPGCVEIFRDFTSFVVTHLGEYVSEYITINEPNVYVVNGYIFGEWPPGQKSFFKGMKVFKNMCLCHYAAYDEIHSVRKKLGFPGETKVGTAMHLRIFDPYNKKSLIDRISAKVFGYLFQDAVSDSMYKGKLRFPIGLTAPVRKARFYEFIGINYYTRDIMKGAKLTVREGAQTNDLGWEIYPEGLRRLIDGQYKRYGAPIYITENGTCDGKDAFRAKYIYDHLKAVCESDAPVERYYHWTFMDNFEWLEGEHGPFGLVRCDFGSGEREVRESGRFYTDIIENKGVTKEAVKKYLQE